MMTPSNLPTVRDWPVLLGRDDVLILDCETTGVQAWSECVEIGAIDTTGADRFWSLVMPVDDVPVDASKVHGYTREDLEELGAPRYDEIHDQIFALLNSVSLILAYNAAFDLRLLQQTAGRYNLSIPPATPWRCIMMDYAAYRGGFHPYYGTPKRHRLVDAVRYEGIDVGDMAHSATGDCRLTLSVVWSVSKK